MIQNKVKRAACLGLSLLMLSPLSACTRQVPLTDDDKTESVVVNDSSVNPQNRLELLDDMGGKYKGRTYTVVTTAAALFEDEADNPLAKAVMARNTLLEQSFSIDIKVKVMEEDDIKSGLRNSAGGAFADLICGSASFLAELAEEGLLENIVSLPYTDLYAEYMPVNSVDEQTAGNSLYFLSSTATLSLNSSVVLFYDKAKLDRAGIMPMSYVKNGTWTWDALAAAAKAAVEETGGNGIGALQQKQEILCTIYASTGNSLITPTKDGAVASYDESIALGVRSIYQKLFEDEALSSSPSESETLKSFINGETAFLMATLDNVSLISGENGKTAEWGILPLPKLSAAQEEYYSPVSAAAAAVAVPKGSSDSAFAGFMLNAFFAASNDVLCNALKQTYVNYYFWNNDSAVTLNRVEQGLRYDISILYSSVPAVYAVTAKPLTDEMGDGFTEAELNSFNDFAEELFG